MEARWMGFSSWLNIYHSWYLPWRQKQALFLTWKRASEKTTGTVGRHLDTMCPTAFLAPTLTAELVSSALSHKMHFFWPSLRCKVIEQMAKSRYLVEFPAQKKEPKWFQNLGRFKKNSSCSVAKKSPKNWTGPCLSLNMVRRKRFIKWQTPSRNAKSSFEGANPTPPSPMQQWRPPARTTMVSRTVGGLGSEGDKTVLLGPKNWNPISSSKCTVLARHG